VVDAVDLRLLEQRAELAVQLSRAGAVVPEGLLRPLPARAVRIGPKVVGGVAR
jgi:hypothetical protein